MSNILKISDAATLALHAMSIMAQNGDELVSVKEISETLGVSYNHLSKVLQRLVKVGLVTSIKGFKGGFKLTKNIDEITFLEIYEAIDGKFSPSNCLLNKDKCAHKCIMGTFLTSINKQVEDFFSQTKLSDFNK